MPNTFQEHVKRQLHFLGRSCQAFDAGAVDEAIRIALVARVLLHDTKKSTSLLKHLGATEIPLLSTVQPLSEPLPVIFEGMGQYQMSITGGQHRASYRAALDRVPWKGFLPAPIWWSQIVRINGPQRIVRRRDLVLAAANKDGGAHVDPELTPEYAALAADGAMGDFVYAVGDQELARAPITDAHLVFMRQVGHELLNSPALTALAG